MKVKRKCENCGKTFWRQRCHMKNSKHHFCSLECYHIWRSTNHPRSTQLRCDWCGKLILRPPCHVQKHNFCSRECYWAWNNDQNLQTQVARERYQGHKVASVCDFCGKTIFMKRSHWERVEHRFCNQKCLIAWQEDRKTETHCDFCGKKLCRPPSLVREHNFCNWECWVKWQAQAGENHPAWKGGYEPYYGPNWQRQRARARARDQFVCQVCGISEKELGQELDVHHLIPFSRFETEDYETANCLANLRSLCPHHHHSLERLSPKEQVMRIRCLRTAHKTSL